MFRKKWIVALITFNAVAIIALAVYLFINFSNLNLTQGIVLIVIAGIIMLSVVGLIIYLTHALASKNNQSKNIPL